MNPLPQPAEDERKEVWMMYTIMPFNRHYAHPATMFDFADAFMRPFFETDRPAPQTFRADMKETPEAWELSVELPGVKPEDISLQAENNVLTVSADVNSERNEERQHYVYTERRTGHMSRSFSLEGVNQEAISAAYENGVLKVMLPKLAPVAPKEPRKIAITGIEPRAEKDEGSAE